MSEPTRIVRVRLGERSYPIEIGAGILHRVAETVTHSCPTWHVVLITDEHVETPHAMTVAEHLAGAGLEVDVVVVPAGEASKSVDTLAALWEKCLGLGTDRQSIVAAVGGGVIGDLAGYLAASFARGLRFVQVPTTLLAQVDSSVGGKVGINLAGGKNMVGAFWQPAAVLIDTQVLTTLPARQYQAGLAEVIKYGVILDADFFALLEENVGGLNQRQDDLLIDVIARCCQLKADVVQQDEREETGLRAVLNYGHTFCHGLETVTGYRELLHGEAVAIGMLCASRLAESLGRIDAEFTRRQLLLLEAVGLPTAVPDVDPQELLAAMRHDKKAQQGKIRFVLPTEMGHVELVEGIDDNAILAALKQTS
ncbi:MAG: 3-dehydroquinate synthase [Planctomycetales bacterium]|nr:3-dehydroquinate synthase [Planctomycetales bacterium]NIM08986.1 3-dehydroquinate synthase [Planctomycetales bacterium]NIN08449.1 3-dehydroquinate synthase [Planctomycetales bacterium]NIN77583.1 3-dehydroquinate synthase [Planctomycetales bacterium]NIO34748.1 3-dehydroquinate synthase [Planctomycetales bacterium]